jgi:hypothetical protein
MSSFFFFFFFSIFSDSKEQERKGGDYREIDEQLGGQQREQSRTE